MKPVRLHEEAEEELATAAEWYEDQRPGLGEEFLAAVRGTLAELAESPGACAPVAGLPEGILARRVRVKGFPYRLIFTELADCLWVVSAPHDRRRPLYWTGRL